MTTIKLEKPFAFGPAQVAEVRLREPTGQMYIDLGEPRIAVASPGGGGYWVEQPDVIKAYLERCIDHDGRGALIALMSFSDARRLKQALFDFFSERPEASGAARPGGSSST